MLSRIRIERVASQMQPLSAFFTAETLNFGSVSYACVNIFVSPAVVSTKQCKWCLCEGFKRR